MKTFAFCLSLLILPVLAQASHLFYQPQNRDAGLQADEWQTLWRDARQEGFDTLIVQWTAHGDSTFDGADGWLRQALHSASEQGLQLILGLDYDEDYYPVMGSEQDKVYYWHHLLSRARLHQQALALWALPVTGWYLPYELDDVLYRDLALLDELNIQLASFAAQSQLPVHLSAFSSGQLSPRVYAHWLDTLKQSGLQVWWQDGAGTGRMPEDAISAYKQALPCGTGIVRERFVVHSGEGEEFMAVPAEAAATHNGSQSECHPAAVFSLRYLPFAGRLRESGP